MKIGKRKKIWIAGSAIVAGCTAGVVGIWLYRNRADGPAMPELPEGMELSENVITASGLTSTGMSEESWELGFLEDGLYVEETYLNLGDEVEAGTPVFKVSEDSLENARQELDKAVTETSLSRREGEITYQTGLMQFASGVIGTIFVTFDVYASETPRIEIYGTEGTLSVPDPNSFGGPVRLYRPGSGEFKEIPLTHGYAENSRGIGVADLANAIRDGRAPRAGVELMYHVLEVTEAFERSGREGRHIELVSKAARPQPLSFTELEGIFND